MLSIYKHTSQVPCGRRTLPVSAMGRSTLPQGSVGEDSVTELLEQQDMIRVVRWGCCAVRGTHRRLLWERDILSREPQGVLVGNDDARGGKMGAFRAEGTAQANALCQEGTWQV